MAHEVKMPKFGETMTEGTIIKWLKAENDQVKEGEPLFEITSDKFNLEVESPASGTLARIVAGEGSVIPIGDLVAVIAEEGEDVSQLVAEDKEETGDEDGQEEVAEAKNKEAEVEEAGPEEETEITTVEGKVKATPAARRLARENEISLEEIKPRNGREAIIAEDVELYLKQRPQASPVAEKMAREYDVDLSLVTGSGPGGRITKNDVEDYRNKSAQGTAGEATKTVPTGEVVPLSNMRKVIAQRMSQSYREAPHVALTTKVNMEKAGALRRTLKSKTEQHITYTDILALAATRALKEYPHMNAHYTEEGLVMLDEINMGIAVDIGEGLVVPVVKNTGSLGLKALAAARESVVSKAQAGKLTADEMQGGTFTITNLGGYGIEIFTPIINPPEIAILGVGQISEEAVVVDGEVTVKPIMWLSLSFDHRAVDGAPAAEFLARLKDLLEDPEQILL